MYGPRILVIGAGAGGLAAATRAKRCNPEAQVVVFEASREFSQGKCSLPYLLSGEVPNESFLQGVNAEYLSESGIELHLETSVLEIQAHQKRLVTTGPTLPFDRLIVSTGSRARPTPFPNIDPSTPRFWKLQTVTDAQKILADVRRFSPRKVAVIGGGYVGLEVAEALSHLGIQASIFHRGATLVRSHPKINHALFTTLEKCGVRVRTLFNVDTLSESPSGFILEGVDQTSSSRHRESFDAIVSAHGTEPDSQLLAQAGARLGARNGALVNTRGETSLSQVYACGDGVELPNSWGGPSQYVPLATTAARLGRVCGENAAGGSARMGASHGALAVRVFEKQLGMLGHPAEWKSSLAVEFEWGNPHSPFARRREGIGVLFLDVRSEKIRGVQALGPDASQLVDLVSLACEQGMTLEELSLQDFSYTPPLSGLWHPLYLAHRTRIKQLQKAETGDVFR